MTSAVTATRSQTRSAAHKLQHQKAIASEHSADAVDALAESESTTQLTAPATTTKRRGGSAKRQAAGVPAAKKDASVQRTVLVENTATETPTTEYVPHEEDTKDRHAPVAGKPGGTSE